MWHKADWMGHPMRLELTLTGLLVKLANHYTTRIFWNYFPISGFCVNCLIDKFLLKILSAINITLPSKEGISGLCHEIGVETLVTKRYSSYKSEMKCSLLSPPSFQLIGNGNKWFNASELRDVLRFSTCLLSVDQKQEKIVFRDNCYSSRMICNWFSSFVCVFV